MSRFVEVGITRETKAVSEKGFGTPLLLATSKALEYKVYTDLSEVTTDFAETTEEYKLLSRMFGQSPRPSEIAVYGIAYADTPTSLTAALNTLIKSHNDFYYLVCPEQGDKEITALAEWTNAHDKIYGATTSNVALAEELSGLYNNAFLIVHDVPTSYVAEGLIAVCAPKTIGSYTWTFKNVAGVPAVAYDATQINAIHENNASTYVEELGMLVNTKGVTTSGEYIDNIQAAHFIKARMTESVFRLLATKDKVPYTDAGIALVVAAMEDVLKQAYTQGIIADDEAGNPLYSIEVPKRADIPTNSVAQRILPDIPWTATVAGAIEKVTIKGVLTL